ncbi:FAS1-like dehydratase domain-containing protein [Halorarius halobius]|uniref:FAS1-like dehydratase domain-containing protein n=1 Tax=Halorarius halobius TaxID=2962671 RepID=UPI0020CF57F1|nr:MaoC family dehydratase N-terminal domain-containing protein [Halorarius halobius]
MRPEEGETVTATRTFEKADVEQFAETTGDRGDHHLEADEQGRLLVHGLLTASLATEIGGRYNVLARTMTYEFRRPVYTGETVRCETTFTSVEERDGDLEVAADLTYVREDDDETVLTGSWDGLIRGGE